MVIDPRAQFAAAMGPKAVPVNAESNAARVRPGDVVSVHWNWDCDVLRPAALARLERATERSLNLANLTV